VFHASVDPFSIEAQGSFQVKAKIRKRLAARRRRIERRLQRKTFQSPTPVFAASNIEYEMSEKTQAISSGGIGVIHQTAKFLRLDTEINKHINLLKIHLPYTESDHVLNIAYNLIAGATCLEHLEIRRHDEAWHNALGVQRIPDPTTAGDFCRRFDEQSINDLMDVINAVRLNVWGLQSQSFLEHATIEADGTMVETGAESKQGIDINHKGVWGYHPLLITLANTGEPLFVVNRSGNRPSHEGAHRYFEKAIQLCRKAGFRQVTLRGDTDLSQTAYLDGWNADGVRFIFGMDATRKLYDLVENLDATSFRKLTRPATYEVKTKPRQRPENVKQSIVIDRNFEDIQLVQEWVAEFSYRPAACANDYRIIAVWKDLEIHKGQEKLFDDSRCFFYITNDFTSSAEEIVREANARCNQENLIQQLKSGVNALAAPVNTLLSNWAYMVIGSLAWSLKAWVALLMPVTPRWKEKHQNEKKRLLRMEFSTFQNIFINIPAQIVRTSRKIVYRLLSWNPWLDAFFRYADFIRRPLRC